MLDPEADGVDEQTDARMMTFIRNRKDQPTQAYMYVFRKYLEAKLKRHV
jgi:hypothetical protein